jgi:hypothetical protein
MLASNLRAVELVDDDQSVGALSQLRLDPHEYWQRRSELPWQ